MVKIRLQRVGRHNRPFYRIVVANSRAAAQSKFIEIVGFYDPIKKTCELKKDRIDYWKGVGAQVSDTASNLIDKDGKIEFKKSDKPNRKSVIRKEREEEEKKAAAEAAKAEKEAAKAAAEEAKKAAETPAEPEVKEETEEKAE